MNFTILTTPQDAKNVNQVVTDVLAKQNLPLELDWMCVDDISNKQLKLLAQEKPVMMIESFKHTLKATLCHYQKADQTVQVVSQNTKQTRPNTELFIKTALDWHKLQRRIVTAGRKNELLLQACKLNAEMSVLDATAGFGHDGLILASTGANVTMMERHPIMALLLKIEQIRMNSEKNWQGLMSQLDIRYGDMRELSKHDDTNFDVVYLDPMFPNASYEAKVGKEMQMLHQFIQSPEASEEKQLLQSALGKVKTRQGRVIVKRPKQAPNLASATDLMIQPNEVWSNDAIRFDGYWKLD